MITWKQTAAVIAVAVALAGIGVVGAGQNAPAAATANPPDTVVTSDAGEQQTATVTVPDVSGDVRVVAFLTVTLRATNPNGTLGAASVSITNQNASETLYADGFTSTYRPGDTRQYRAVDLDATSGDVIAFNVTTSLGDGVAWRLSYGVTATSRAAI